MTDTAVRSLVMQRVRWREHDHQPRPCCVDAILTAIAEAGYDVVERRAGLTNIEGSQ